MTADTAVRSGPQLRFMRRRHLFVAATLPIVLLALLGVVLVARGPAASPTAVGAPAPDFSLADLEGNPIGLAELRGRPVIVNFWASWCLPCIEEFPLLRDAADRHAGDGLAVIGIVYQDRSRAARAFMADNDGTWPVAMDPGGEVADAYGILGPPETFFIGRDGTIQARQFGQFTAATLDRHLAAIIDAQ